MPGIDLQESETLEFKRQWTDRALEDLAAFANTRGGTLLVGIREGGEIVGAKVDDREIQRIANLIAAHLGITPSIRVVEMEKRPVLEIRVESAAGLVSCRGRYLRRVGTTNRDFASDELARHLLGTVCPVSGRWTRWIWRHSHTLPAWPVPGFPTWIRKTRSRRCRISGF